MEVGASVETTDSVVSGGDALLMAMGRRRRRGV